MDNEQPTGGWADGLDFVPDPAAKQHALEEFATDLNPQKVRGMRAAGLDIIEAQRSGPWVWDLDGRRFLDCFTSAGSFNVGRRNPRVVAAAHAALDRLDHGNFLLCSREKAELAAKLAEITPGDLSCTMFGTGGGEAVDFAIKLARGSTGRPRIVSSVNGYHGHTGFALSAAGREAFRQPFEPLLPEFVQVPFGEPDVLAVMEETDLVAHAAAMGERLFTGLRSIAEARPEVVAEVRGLGLMAGIEYSEDSMGPRMSYHLARHGVLAIYSGNQPAVMRLMPSLVIEEAEVDFLLEALDRAISDLVSGAGPEEPTPTRPRRRPVRPVAAAG